MTSTSFLTNSLILAVHQCGLSAQYLVMYTVGPVICSSSIVHIHHAASYDFLKKEKNNINNF